MSSGTIIALAQLVTALAVFVTAVSGVWLAARKLSAVEAKVDVGLAVVADVQTQVTTINGKTIAQLTDATESRRIEHKPEDERTAAEDQHLAIVPTEPTT